MRIIQATVVSLLINSPYKEWFQIIPSYDINQIKQKIIGD
jgi:hypothetical protein